MAVLAIAFAGLTTSHAQTPSPTAPPAAGFSFAAYGDSRTMMYLPPKDGQPDLTKLFVEMFGLVLPGEGRGRSGEEGCEADLRSGHQGTHSDHHAVHE